LAGCHAQFNDLSRMTTPNRLVNWAIWLRFRKIARIKQPNSAKNGQRYPPWQRLAANDSGPYRVKFGRNRRWIQPIHPHFASCGARRLPNIVAEEQYATFHIRQDHAFESGFEKEIKRIEERSNSE
jgi:hypothetical protein